LGRNSFPGQRNAAITAMLKVNVVLEINGHEYWMIDARRLNAGRHANRMTRASRILEAGKGNEGLYWAVEEAVVVDAVPLVSVTARVSAIVPRAFVATKSPVTAGSSS
jgi:hypothetical protein